MNIMLVDDERVSRQSVAEFLRELGHYVVESSNGCDALDVFPTGEFHLVLSDIRMPKMSGIELLRRLRGGPGGLNADIILFTGYGDMQSAIEALRAGAYDYLLKPIDVEELATVTERVAAHLGLRRENKLLTGKFKDVVKMAAKETRQESAPKACCKTLGPNIGFFSESMRKVLQMAQKLHADRSIPVLIEGETGTGKEVVARCIHDGKGDIAAPFVDLNCAAIAPGIFESELFGYEAGAFTGGLPSGQKGKLDMAAGGTLFLDEISEIPVHLQAKLLRVIQEKEFYRVGGLKKIKADVRIVCATNVDIEKKVREGTFRQDLFYRLDVGRVYLPPLRQRVDDILPLARMFLAQIAGEKGKKFQEIDQAAAELLFSYSWPGNVRELKNALERAVLLWDDSRLKPCHLAILQKEKTKVSLTANDRVGVIDCENFTLPPNGLPIEEYFDNIILKVLEMKKGNKTETAKYLGISRRTLYCRLKRFGEKKNAM